MKQYILFICCIGSSLYGATSSNIHHYLWANYHHFNHSPHKAEKHFTHLLKESSSIYHYKGYVPFLFEQRDFQKIAQLMPKLDATFANDIAMQLLFVQALTYVGKKQEADTRILQLNQKDKTNQEAAFYAIQVYMQHRELKNALDVINKFLNSAPQKPNNFLFHFFKSQIYVQMNEHTQALTCVQQCIDLYPLFDKAWLLKAMIEEQQGNVDAAIQGYTNFLQVTKEPTQQVEQHIKQLIQQQSIGKHYSDGDFSGSFIPTIQSIAQTYHYGTSIVQQQLSMATQNVIF